MQHTWTQTLIDRALWSKAVLRAYGIYFIPSTIMIFGAISLIYSPHLVVPIFALFFMSIGVVSAVVVWKLLVYKEKLHTLINRFDGRIMVHGVKLDELTEDQVLVPDPKDQIIH